MSGRRTIDSARKLKRRRTLLQSSVHAKSVLSGFRTLSSLGARRLHSKTFLFSKAKKINFPSLVYIFSPPCSFLMVQGIFSSSCMRPPSLLKTLVFPPSTRQFSSSLRKMSGEKNQARNSNRNSNRRGRRSSSVQDSSRGGRSVCSLFISL